MRYSRYTPMPMYQAESFKDLAVVPMAMRVRHDNILNEQDKLLNEYNNLEVLQEGESQDYYNKKKQEIEAKVNGLANKLKKLGFKSVTKFQRRLVSCDIQPEKAKKEDQLTLMVLKLTDLKDKI